MRKRRRISLDQATTREEETAAALQTPARDLTIVETVISSLAWLPGAASWHLSGRRGGSLGCSAAASPLPWSQSPAPLVEATLLRVPLLRETLLATRYFSANENGDTLR